MESVDVPEQDLAVPDCDARSGGDPAPAEHGEIQAERESRFGNPYHRLEAAIIAVVSLAGSGLVLWMLWLLNCPDR